MLINNLYDIVNGKRMTNEDFLAMYRELDLIQLGKAANEVRLKKFKHNYATFIIDRNINYTNICSCQCKFCAFYRRKEDEDAYVIDDQTLLDKIEEAVRMGATQVMIQGGLHEDLDINYFKYMFKLIISKYEITIHSLTAPEIVHIAIISNLSIKVTLVELK
ncbi:MAG: radical SAM protein, partial [Syntrophomonadaceae bacterium]|nr:radical SAM protein [Syntrophomonadaceae bacterium]